MTIIQDNGIDWLEMHYVAVDGIPNQSTVAVTVQMDRPGTVIGAQAVIMGTTGSSGDIGGHKIVTATTFVNLVIPAFLTEFGLRASYLGSSGPVNYDLCVMLWVRKRT